MPGRGVGVRARREREHVERGEGQLFHEAQRLVELRVRLAGKAGNEVRREVEARVRTHRARRERAVALRHDAAAHPLEDAERARLQRQMEVRDDDARRRDEIDEGLAGFHGLERGEPDPARGRVVLEPREEVDERASRGRGRTRRGGCPRGRPRARRRLRGGGRRRRRPRPGRCALSRAARARRRTRSGVRSRPGSSRNARVRSGSRSASGGRSRAGIAKSAARAAAPVVTIRSGRRPASWASRISGSASRAARETTRSTSGISASDSPPFSARQPETTSVARGFSRLQAAHEAPAVALGAIRDRAAVHEEDVRAGGSGRLHRRRGRLRRGARPPRRRSG